MTDPFAEKTLEESSWIIFKEELEGVSIDVFGPRGRKRREKKKKKKIIFYYIIQQYKIGPRDSTAPTESQTGSRTLHNGPQYKTGATKE